MPILFASACSGPALTNGSVVDLAGQHYTVQAPERIGALRRTGPASYRVSLAPGDRWVDEKSDKRTERAELSARERFAYGDEVGLDLTLRFAQIDPANREWFIVAQLHGPNRDTLPAGRRFGSPPLALELRGDELLLLVRGDSESLAQPDDAAEARIIARYPIIEGGAHRIALQAHLGADGWVAHQFDDRPGALYRGAVGYDAGDRAHYWKLGAYRHDGATGTVTIEGTVHCLGALRECSADKAADRPHG